MAAKARSTRSNGNDSREQTVAPYYKRLDPTHEFEYGAEIETRNGGSFRQFEVTIFDDRDDVGQRTPGIIVQFRKAGKFGATATFTFADSDEAEAHEGFEEFLDDMREALDEFTPAPSPRGKRGR